MRTMRVRLGVALLSCVCGVAARPVSAQDMTLERVQNLIAAGRFTDAGNTLAEWERTSGNDRSNASSADRARALYLRGVLSTDAKVAEQAFVSVVLSYPSTPIAPQALLRLGQSLVAGAEPRRAAAYLERLRSDYPGARERDTGLLWLARAHHAVGAAAAACTVAREAASSGDANVRVLAELERDRACGTVTTPRAAARDTVARGTVPPRTAANDTLPRGTVPPPTVIDTLPRGTLPPRTTTTPTTTRTDAGTRTGNYAVQTAAFSVRPNAEAVATKLRTKGFDVRITLVEGSTLHHVRVGQYLSATEASSVAQRVRQAGFDAIIVNDVRKEQRR